MFDPYRKWLGIPPKDQPPHHYRLLSLELYENDLDVIEGAADRAMGFVRQYQSGEHAPLAAKMLNEIATARLCLLKPASKADYDAKLKRQLSPTQPVKEEFPSFVDDADVADLVKASKPLPKRKKKAAKSDPTFYLVAGGLAAAALLTVGMIAFRNGSKGPDQTPSVNVETNSIASSTKEAQESAKSPPNTAPTKNILLIESKLFDEPYGPSVDLLPNVDLKRDVFAGEWRKEGSSLVGGNGARIYLPAKLSEDYQLKFQVKRLTDNDTLMLGFIMVGRLGTLAIDAYESAVSGLYLDGRDPNGNCTTRQGALLKNNLASTIVLTVHPGHLHADVDGKTIIDWYGTPDRLHLNSDHHVPNREIPYIAISRASYQIDSAVMIPIKPEPPAPRIEKLDAPVDLMPLLDTERDGKRGIWALNKNVLHSPEAGNPQFCLPVSVPLEYTFSTSIEVPMGSPNNATLGIGILAGNAYCTLTIANDNCLGIEKIDGLRWESNETRVRGPFFVPGTPVKLSTTVTQNAIRVDLDDRTIINWKGDFRRFTVQDDWAPIDGRKLFIETRHHIKFRDLQLGPPTAPKVPSHPEFKVGRPVDLLSLINPKRDALEGDWEKDGAALRVMGTRTFISKLAVPCEIPAEYKLTMRITRENSGASDNEPFVLKLPTESSMAQVGIDGFVPMISAVAMDRLYMNDPRNPSINQLQVLPVGQPQELVAYVRKTGLKIMNGTKTVIDWTGNPSRFYEESHWATTGGRIALAGHRAQFRFDKLELEPLEPSSFPPVPPLGTDGNLLALIDPVRDSRKGQWTKNADGLVIPVFPAPRLTVPVVPPERYVITTDVERRKGDHELSFGLVVGGHPCNVSIDAAGSQSALELLDDKPFQDKLNFTRQEFPGPLLPQGKRVKVRCFVLPDTVFVTVDDKEAVKWHGDARRLSLKQNLFLPPNYSKEDRSQLWLGEWESEFLIRELTLRPLSDEEAARIKRDITNNAPTE